MASLNLEIEASNSRGESLAKLRNLHSEREIKREEVGTLFQRKRELMEQIKQIEAQMNQLHSVLFDMDDQITILEEALGPTSEQHAVVAPQESRSTLRTIPMPVPMAMPMTMTMNPDEVLPDPSMTFPDEQYTQAREEVLTDPLSATQTEALSQKMLHAPDIHDDDNGFNRPARVSMSSTKRPQLDLQPFHRNSGKSTPLNHSFTTDPIHNVLHNTFRIPTFRKNQLAIIQATLAKEDCFVIMRTGGGKSLLYQLPVVLERPKITLVISPLLSLMQDQQDQVNAFCPNVCVSFHSGLSKSEQAANWRRVKDPTQNVGMILVTPERVLKSNLLKAELQTLYANQRFARIVIDECHCCCQWGHDFRPDYAKLGVLRKTFANVPILAVTATASERVRDDCCQILRLRPNYRFFRSTANRPNLTYSIQRKDGSAIDTMDDIVDFIQANHPRSAGIVYTRTRKEADTVAKELASRGIGAEAYYSDVTPAKKAKIHKSWMQNKTQVVVATIAFGLGINKPDVRFVIHHSMSKTLEAYYQESGRAGRDGNPSDCVLFYSPKDVPKMIGMVHAEQSSQLTWTMIKYAQHFGSDNVCRAILLHNLGEPDHDMEAVLQQYHETTTPRDVVGHSQTVLQLLYSLQDDKVTMPMLVKEWRTNVKTSPHQCVRDNPPGKDLSVFECEYIIVALMLQQLIAADVQYTAYDTVVYLRCTNRAEQFLTSPRAQMTIRLPPKVAKSPTARLKSTTPSDDSGWIETKNTKLKRASSASTSTSIKRLKSSQKLPSKSTTKKSTTTKKATKQSKLDKIAIVGPARNPFNASCVEVIAIDDDSSSENNNSDKALILLRRPRRQTASTSSRDAIIDDLMIDSDPD